MNRFPLLAALAVAFLAPPLAASDDADHPHIVYILADDLGYGDVEVQNPHSEIPTPNLNRLAKQGRRFTDAHVTAAVCTPTRYAILTGRYSWRSELKAGVLRGWSPPLIDDGRMTVASLLSAHGYRTAVVGKWHLGLGWQDKDATKPLDAGPTTIGFDHSFIVPASLDMSPYCYVSNLEVPAPPTAKAPADLFGRPGVRTPGLKPAAVLPDLAEEATRVIRTHGRERSGDPLFLYFPLTAPHKPVAPSSRFRGETEMGPYGDFVREVDWVVGEVMKALEKANMADDTLLIFTGDNGASPNAASSAIDRGHMPNRPYRGGKTTLWEGGHREPFLVRWPGHVKPGTTDDTLISTADLLATCADIVGAELPPDAGEDSVSMLPHLRPTPPDEPIRRTLVHRSGNGSLAIRSGKWKLITIPGGGGWGAGADFGMEKIPVDKDLPMQLYNLDADPREKNNLYRDRPKVAKRLLEELTRQVNRGRSTPGPPQPNDTGHWDKLHWMSKADYKNDEIAQQ